jgi:hypothetical protein
MDLWRSTGFNRVYARALLRIAGCGSCRYGFGQADLSACGVLDC